MKSFTERPSEWLSTREVANRLGYRHLPHLRKQLEALGVRCMQLGNGRKRWAWEDVVSAAMKRAASVPRGTISGR